jgi:Asp-tRNA(Asn)/Glu-tRNA(Gln) amidotransferase A subunit family amidase
MEQGVADAKLVGLSATQAAAAIAKDEFSSQDYVGACLERIEAAEPVVHAFAHIDPEYALRQAKDCDDWRQSGRPIGPLHGVPVGIKDIIDTADYPAECGSAALAGRRPKEDATLVTKLRGAGAVIIGKTVTTEFAYFTPGATRNPHDTKRTPGGSSSGTAAAVAAGMVPVAIGSQTNGSIIRPASFCGVFAMKPSHGVVSRAGVLPLSRSLDHMGPFARARGDLALVVALIAG